MLSREAEQQIRDIARAYGVDGDYLVREVRTARVTVSRNSDGTRGVTVHGSRIDPTAPQQRMQSIAHYLAGEILFNAYGAHKPWDKKPATPDFSEAAIVGAACNYNRLYRPSELRGQSTFRWLEAEARRLGVDSKQLGNALMDYRQFSDAGNIAMAEASLRLSGLPANAAEVVRLASSRLDTARVGNGPTYMSITARGVFAVRREITRNERLRRIV